jgi:DNA-directed RNA polymerase specialized sigma24 family protein
MSTQAGSITRLIPSVLQGDEIAIEEIWRKYVARIEGLARPLITGLPAGAGDEQDVAQSAFRAFCAAVANGQAPRMDSRDELWRLLATISRNKATDTVRRELRDRRGGGAVASGDRLAHVAIDEASPSEVAQLQEAMDELLAAVDASGDQRLKAIALMRLEGRDTHEIAMHLDCTVRTVQRKLHLLERLWDRND